MRGSANRARSLRRNSTEAEQKLWSILRNRKIDGYKFVRQYPIGPYFADFCCREAALIVEVDGGQHDQSASDTIRTNFPTRQGYVILRFWNTDVLLNLEGVHTAICAKLANCSPSDLRYAAPQNSPFARAELGARAATTKKRSYRLNAETNDEKRA